MSTEKTIRSAYHEAGHIVCASYYGYACDGVEILECGNGKSLLDYGEDLLPFIAMTNFNSENRVYADLNKKARRRCASIAVPMAMILMAGPIAESLYIWNSERSKDENVDISGPDLDRVEQICSFLRTFYIHGNSESYVSDLIRQTTVMVCRDEFWNPITCFAKHLLATPGYKLNKAEVDKLIRVCEFPFHSREIA